MSNLLARILTAIIAGAIAIAAIVYSTYGLMFFCAVVSLAGLWEFYQVSVAQKALRLAGMGLGALIWGGVLLAALNGEAVDTYWRVSLLAIPLFGMLTLFQPSEHQPVATMGSLVLGLVYCYLPLLLFFDLSTTAPEYDFRLPLGILMLTWILDIGAYFAGRFLGKNPLFKRISPKKTWEGAIGGGLFCLGLGMVFQFSTWGHSVPHINWIVIASIIAVFSQYGDLVESMIKRSVDLKDSGSILPGHGGMLDRFDGTYLSIPLIYLYLSFI